MSKVVARLVVADITADLAAVKELVSAFLALLAVRSKESHLSTVLAVAHNYARVRTVNRPGLKISSTCWTSWLYVLELTGTLVSKLA